jgi:methyltransferase (TIGR00027 family)
VRAFEVDAPKTQAVKRELLARTGIDASGIVFVSADFEREDWYAQLTASGFDPNLRTLVIWEGVTMYLDRASVDNTLRKVAGMAPGSAIVFDYFTTEPLSSHSLYMRYARAATRGAGEPLTFGVDSTPPVAQRVTELVEAAGLRLGEHHEFGESDTTRAWGGFATGIAI